MASDPQRRAAVLETLQHSDLDFLISFSPTRVLLLTGYWPVIGASVAIATRRGEVFAIVPEDEMELASATSDVQLTSYHPHSLDRLTSTSDALGGPLRQMAKRLSLAGGKIGADLRDDLEPASYQSGNHFRTSLLQLLHEAFSNLAVVSADALLDRLESIKTATEINLLRHASQLASKAFAAASSLIGAGRCEDEVAAELEAVFNRSANDGFERGRGYFFCMSGSNSAKASGAYARTRRRVIEEGDLVMIHANTVGDGFWTDITRTFVVGEPSEQQQKMREAIMQARGAALKAIKPDAQASAVDAAARDVLKAHGFGAEFKDSTGHGVGFAAANPNALPRIHPHSPDILAPGMTFNIEPAIYIDGIGGMRHCDVVACTGSGAEVLTNF
jgi:Xaa-Pro aminopeptidase